VNGNLRVGNLFGIPFFINISWFFVLALTTLNFGGGLLAQYPALGVWAIALGLISGLLLFASVLLHELGHSFVAQRQGIRVNSITLLLFGGLASLEEEAKTPAGAFWIAVAGPLVMRCCRSRAAVCWRVPLQPSWDYWLTSTLP
jgi:Zn-dependent protease